MANLDKTVEIIFAGVDKTGSIFSGVGKKLDQFSGKVQNVAGPLSNVADDVLKLDTALAAMAVAGLAVAVNQAGKFGDSFNEITTLIDDTGQGVDQFRTDILNYARDSGKSMEDIESAIYTAISAGTSYKDSLALLANSEKLSIATKSELESSTKLLASTLNAYGASTDEATRYSDILFQTVKNGQTTFPELSTSLGSVLNIAANSGVPFETLSAAIAAVTATGAPTSQAITSIQAALANIIKPSTNAAKMANELGIEFNATALKTKGFEKILQEVYTATGGSADKMAVLFGDVNGLSSAMTLGADTSGKFKNSLEAMANSAGATETAYKKMADNFELINQNLGNNVKATFIQIGTELQGSYGDIVKAISETFKSVGVSIDAGAFKDVFKVLNDFGDDIEQFFTEFAKSLPEALAAIDWSDFLDALGDLGDSIGSMFDNFDPSDPEDVKEAIQFVVESITSLIRVTKGMVDGFKPFIQAILNSVDAFNKMDKADKETAGSVLALAKAITSLGAGLTAVMLAIGNNADQIKTTFEVVAGSIELAWGALKTGILGIADVFLGTMDLILAAAQGLTFGEWDDKVTHARQVVQYAMKDVEKHMFNGVDNVHDGWGRIVDAFSKGADEASKATDSFSKDPIEMPGVDMGKFKTDLVQAALDWQYLNDELESSDLNPEIKVKTNFDDVQSEWDTINQQINSFDFGSADGGIGKELGLTFKTTYKWTDADGGLHLTDSPPNPGEAVGDVEEIKAPIKVDVDDKEIDKAKKKIKSAFTKSSMGDVNLGFSFGENGMGAVTDGLKDALANMEPIDGSGALDFSGLSDLLEALGNVKDPFEAERLERAIRENVQGQNKLLAEDAKNLRVRRAIAEQELRTAQMMKLSGEQDRTIKIEASGLEAEMEAFMWKLLKKIQARANASGAEFLLAAT